MISDLNDFISGRRNPYEKKDDDNSHEKHQGDDNDDNGSSAKNEGTLILDATCVPQDIRYPPDGCKSNC